VRLRRDGQPSAHPYPSPQEWPLIRRHLLDRSLQANPLLDPALTAYTPGETVGLLGHPQVAAWHKRAVRGLSSSYKHIVLVPCAKTKPWEGPAVRRSKLYSAYNALRSEKPETCFVTISEPLGIVPMAHWGDFPQYDNPGLFRDDSQRSGMTTAQWQASPFGRAYGLPFDEAAQEECIQSLGLVVARFLANNADCHVVSVVDDTTPTTHGAMLDVALAQGGVSVERHLKRSAPRVSPLGHLREVLASCS
jgi:hypothetical protein